jgi:hypothetical protein
VQIYPTLGIGLHVAVWHVMRLHQDALFLHLAPCTFSVEDPRARGRKILSLLLSGENQRGDFGRNALNLDVILIR